MTDLAKAISRESARIHQESHALIPATVLTRLDNDAVVTILEFDLLAGEEAMIAAGWAETVLALRHRSELDLELALTAAVERTTGRKVRRFLTQTDLEEAVAFEVYLLAPAERAAA